MKTQVSELADNRVRLEIEVPAADVDHAFEHALHDLSGSVRVPGFRKGKAPAPMVARQVGRQTVVEEALRDHLTGWYSRAVAVAGIDPIDRPTIDWSDEPVEGSPFAFTADVDVKPRPEVRAYKGLEGVRTPVEVPEQAVDEEIERLRGTVAELAPAERGAESGDFVVIDFQGTLDGKPFDGGGGTDYGVDLGGGRLIEELERGIIGMSAGDRRDVEFSMPGDYPATDLAGKAVSFQVDMKEVKSRNLPDLDDELATSVSEFDTLDELRADIRERFRAVIQEQSDRVFRSSVLSALAQELSTPVPDALVQNRVADLTRGMISDLRARGVELDDYLRITGQSGEELVAAIRPQAEDGVRKDLAVEAVAMAEDIQVTDEMVEEWVREQALEADEEPDQAVERLLGDPAVLTALRTDLAMQKALDIVVENAKEITPEQAEAKEKLWTPEKETAASGAKSSSIWTPGSGEPADR